jgi:hypothetical protein
VDRPVCTGCGRGPDHIYEYQELVESEGYEDDVVSGLSAAELAVIRGEGTYNDANGHFWCTECYVKAGMPLGKAP